LAVCAERSQYGSGDFSDLLDRQLFGGIVIKRAIQSVAKNMGYEVRRLSWDGMDHRLAMMRRLGVNWVLDVGANDGQYASELRRNGYEGRIWSYEPLQDAFSRLDKVAAPDPLWKAINCGCGAKAGSATINIAGNSYSSSLLPMLDKHLMNAPSSAYVSEETVSICSLDESVVPHVGREDRVWLKIDTQGYEAEVIKGAQRLIPSICGMECELSLVPLYKGQILIDEMLAMIYAAGFKMVGVAPLFFEAETNYTLQVDGIFLREFPS
jgi:FkbM family methyltransferase